MLPDGELFHAPGVWCFDTEAEPEIIALTYLKRPARLDQMLLEDVGLAAQSRELSIAAC
jgi:hypothetical protein